jgi:Leucine-rich repeat (LRR) protein
MKNLEELNLDSCEYDNAYLLSENKKLRSLTINHGFEIDILDLGFLSDVKTLEEIKIYGNDFIPRRCQNLETVLEIPSLEAVKVYGIDIFMDLEHIKKNKSFKTLDFQFVSIANMDSSGEIEEMELSDTLELVKNFPNLEVVTVKSSKLNSIEWVKHLKNLRELDVTDNYISDFSVLDKLSKLERLVCSENANTNVKLDDDEVEIICNEN